MLNEKLANSALVIVPALAATVSLRVFSLTLPSTTCQILLMENDSV